MTKFAKWKRWQKLMQGLYPNHMHIFILWRKHLQSFKKIGIKMCEELRSQGTHCLFIEVKKWLKFTKWKKWQKMTSQLQATLFISSPGDQTKYLELSVVWDSQFVTWVTLYMYTDCLDHRDYNLHVHVFGNDVLEFKYPLTELLISDTNFEKAVTEIKECWWLLTSKNAVKQCSITKVTKAPLRTL